MYGTRLHVLYYTGGNCFRMFSLNDRSKPVLISEIQYFTHSTKTKWIFSPDSFLHANISYRQMAGYFHNVLTIFSCVDSTTTCVKK